MTDSILASIRHEYRPYDTMPEFNEGYEAYQRGLIGGQNPYPSGYKAQAWDRGANAAMLYKRALMFLDAPPEMIEAVRPNWLADILRRGRTSP